MGILYDSMKKVHLHQELKQKFVLERLLKQGITESKEGKSVHDMDYEELKEQLVLAAFREIDAENEQQKWF